MSSLQEHIEREIRERERERENDKADDGPRSS